MNISRNSVIDGKKECYSVYDFFVVGGVAIVDFGDKIFINIHHIGLNTLTQ